MSPEQRAPAAPPSWADRLALAAVVAVACVGEVGCLRDLHPGSSIRAFGANVRLYGVLLFLVHYLSVLAPFIGAIVGSSVLRAGGYIRAGFVGLTAYLGLAAGLSFAGPDRNVPELTDYLAPGVMKDLASRLAEAGFYVDPARAEQPLQHRPRCDAIQAESGVELDLIVRKDRPQSVEELRRRQPAELGSGTPVMITSPEDSILSKLESARMAGRSEKQLAEVVGVLEVQGDRLDLAYLERWAVELGVADLWGEVRGSLDGG